MKNKLLLKNNVLLCPKLVPLDINSRLYIRVCSLSDGYTPFPADILALRSL